AARTTLDAGWPQVKRALIDGTSARASSGRFDLSRIRLPGRRPGESFGCPRGAMLTAGRGNRSVTTSPDGVASGRGSDVPDSAVAAPVTAGGGPTTTASIAPPPPPPPPVLASPEDPTRARTAIPSMSARESLASGAAPFGESAVPGRH